MMPASAVQTKTWFRPKGWFTDREEAIVVNRVLRDDPSKGDMHNRQAITPKRLWNSMKDYDLWPLYAIGLIAYIPQAPADKYVTLILKSVGFDTFNTNLLTIPSVSSMQYLVISVSCLCVSSVLTRYLGRMCSTSSLCFLSRDCRTGSTKGRSCPCSKPCGRSRVSLHWRGGRVLLFKRGPRMRLCRFSCPIPTATLSSSLGCHEIPTTSAHGLFPPPCIM